MFCVVFWRNIRRQSPRYDHYACLLLLFIVTLLVLLFLLSDNCEKTSADYFSLNLSFCIALSLQSRQHSDQTQHI